MNCAINAGFESGSTIVKNICQKFIPSILADPFHELYCDRQIPTKTDIRNFINNIRIQNYLDLKSLPANKDKSVIELAMQCGFSNTATFYRAYKKAMEE